MRLIELSCDQPSFRTVRFNAEGLTLILGDGPNRVGEDGSSNGVGKTLALGLIHHCLGGKTEKRLHAAAGGWLFSLSFELSGTPHTIERSGDGKHIALDGKTMKQTGLREWLDSCGVFWLDQAVPMLSFRSLFKRFARYEREDCLDPLKMKAEQDFEARLRSLYLLGLDCALPVRKRQEKVELDHLAATIKSWQNDDILKDIFRAGAKPRVRAEWLEREIPRLRGDLEQFQVAEDYRAIELEAGQLTLALREHEKRAAIIRFQMESIDKSLAQHPDISRTDLLQLYKGLQGIFREEALAHFKAVEEFHQSLAVNRRTRLEHDKLRLKVELDQAEASRREAAQTRDAKIQLLQGKRALDEYASTARQLATLEEEQHKLTEFLTLTARLQGRAQQIRERRIEDDRLAADYLFTNPERDIDNHFREFSELMYPRAPAGIVLDNNTGNNQLRYDLTVQIEGQDSDGINSARIMCFDWLLLMHGANHSMGFLWHDNRIFADIDPKARAAWFTHAVGDIRGTGKQYIATLNTENFSAMAPHLDGLMRQTLDNAVRLTLKGNAASQKLLGIQFGT